MKNSWAPASVRTSDDSCRTLELDHLAAPITSKSSAFPVPWPQWCYLMFCLIVFWDALCLLAGFVAQYPSSLTLWVLAGYNLIERYGGFFTIAGLVALYSLDVHPMAFSRMGIMSILETVMAVWRLRSHKASILIALLLQFATHNISTLKRLKESRLSHSL